MRDECKAQVSICGQVFCADVTATRCEDLAGDEGKTKPVQADLLECEWEHSRVSAINRIYTD